MTAGWMRVLRALTCAAALAASPRPAGPASQVQDGAGALVRELARPPGNGAGRGFFTCGSIAVEASEGRRIALALAERGPEALAAVEVGLRSIESEGQRSVFAANGEWLLFAFTRITGKEAFPRLRRMMDSAQLAFLHGAISTCISIALGLTSYVDGSKAPPDLMCRGQQPRDSLNQLTFALESGDRARLISAVGPKARQSLRALGSGEVQRVLNRASSARAQSGTPAVGYLLSGTGRWSVAEAFYVDGGPSLDPRADLPEVVIDSEFVGRSGAPCGRFPVQFARIGVKGTAQARYLVDNANIQGLLRVVSDCASQ